MVRPMSACEARPFPLQCRSTIIYDYIYLRYAIRQTAHSRVGSVGFRLLVRIKSTVNVSIFCRTDTQIDS